VSAFELELATSTPTRFQVDDEDRVGAGKQGAVYTPHFDPTVAVKLYHNPKVEDGERLEVMKLIAQPGDFAVRPSGANGSHLQLAWPYELVSDPGAREVVGYTMPRYPTEEFLQLDVLWHPLSREERLPDPNWLFLLSVARNLATLAAMVHERGLVLGDVRDANFVVSSRTALVALLDCDSMPITDPRSERHFPCLLSHPDYAPPELQVAERAAAHVPRSQHTDNFSLAVLICRLLLAGDHPFAGYPAVADDDDEGGDIGQNIRAGRSYLVAPNEVLVPEGSVRPDVLPGEVLKLARQAFSVGLREPEKRPRAATWRAALSASLTAVSDCPIHPQRHNYSSELWSCPWCHGESDPFPAPVAAPVTVEAPPSFPLALTLLLSVVVLVATLVALLVTHVI
jgi:DNA-binding helix-hairpin-helix protein with protein kinase domain